MRADWSLPPEPPGDYFAALGDVHQLTARTLYARGFVDPQRARDFLNGGFTTVDPFSLADMPRAVERIAAAISAGERIVIYGDYDCDGVTACALLKTTLDSLGANATVYIPNRFEEGYGLNAAALDAFVRDRVGLVVTVDCGARALREADHARTLGLDLIITDHHEPEPNALPAAYAFVNPNRHDCPYPFKKLAGVGVAFRLAQCLLRTLRRPGAVSESSLLDFVAIGTVADVVSLTGDNRLLVRRGLEEINKAPRLGLSALMQVAGLSKGAVDVGKIGFVIAPRLNAAGRLESALAAYNLLTAADPALAQELALQLNAQNEQRQQLTAQVTQEAERQALTRGGQVQVLFAAGEHFNPGVIGLAAARLVEKHYRPSIVVSVSNGEARGSCRSVHGYHITRALDSCADMLHKHGGHAAAAGFTTRSDLLELLCERLNAHALSAEPEGGWRRRLDIDAVVPLDALDWKAYEALQQLGPHGVDNPRPLLAARNVRVVSAARIGRAEGAAGAHLKLYAKDARGVSWACVAWRMGDRVEETPPGAVLDLAFQLDANEWNGSRRLQLVLQDFRPAQSAS